MNPLRAIETRRGAVIAVAIASVGVLAGAGFATAQIITRPGVDDLEPTPGGVTADATPTLRAILSRAEGARDVRVRLDGRDVTHLLRARDERLSLRPASPLGDGVHEAELAFRSDNLLARSVTRRWQFSVDTARPRLAVDGARGARVSDAARVRFIGAGEPGSDVTLAWGDSVHETRIKDNGRWLTTPRLPEGDTLVTVTATDAAGNERATRRRVIVDTAAPQLTAEAPKVLAEADLATVSGAVPGERAQRLVYGVTINDSREIALTAADQVEPESTYYYSPEPTEPAIDIAGRRFALSVPDLPQGRNRLTVFARDRAGNEARRKLTVQVDSSEEFGAHKLVRGARGADVRALQGRLRQLKLTKRAPTGRYDAKTAAAVKGYQRRFGLTPTGLVNRPTLERMAARVVINVDQRRLRLIRDGRVVKTYQVAVGQSAYPTPRGRYEIVDKQVDPAWFPPDSPWAAGLGPIPPGPGNPLGTRWIGTSAPAIGIHGTYDSGSIGTAASHGCVRMHIPDVEELYDEVALGGTVEFR